TATQTSVDTAWSSCWLGNCVGVFVILLFEKLRYGRYSDSKYGFPVNAKFAWFVQEMPSFFVPLCLLVWASPAKTSLLPNQLLIAMYIFHYAQRSGRGDKHQMRQSTAETDFTFNLSDAVI
uniref:Steroid 5-alpha reductase C-terminal domain-containing protein n=1 Tax=Monopterus albus TaxID=43700 RepID=A0A3Q3J4H4_MONAL